jgi:hypothetical protein
MKGANKAFSARVSNNATVHCQLGNKGSVMNKTNRKGKTLGQFGSSGSLASHCHAKLELPLIGWESQIG